MWGRRKKNKPESISISSSTAQISKGMPKPSMEMNAEIQLTESAKNELLKSTIDIDGIVKFAIEHLKEGIDGQEAKDENDKVQMYLGLCADLTKKIVDRRHEGKEITGRLFLSAKLANQQGEMTTNARQTRMVDGVSTNIENPKYAYNMGVAGFWDEMVKNKKTPSSVNLQENLNSLQNNIESNNDWQNFWREKLEACKNNEERQIVSEGYNVIMKELIYAVVSHTAVVFKNNDENIKKLLQESSANSENPRTSWDAKLSAMMGLFKYRPEDNLKIPEWFKTADQSAAQRILEANQAPQAEEANVKIETTTEDRNAEMQRRETERNIKDAERENKAAERERKEAEKQQREDEKNRVREEERVIETKSAEPQRAASVNVSAHVPNARLKEQSDLLDGLGHFLEDNKNDLNSPVNKNTALSILENMEKAGIKGNVIENGRKIFSKEEINQNDILNLSRNIVSVGQRITIANLEIERAENYLQAITNDPNSYEYNKGFEIISKMKSLELEKSIIANYDTKIRSAEKNISVEIKTNAQKDKLGSTILDVIAEPYVNEPPFRAELKGYCDAVDLYKNSLSPKELQKQEKFLAQLEVFMAPCRRLANLQPFSSDNLTPLEAVKQYSGLVKEQVLWDQILRSQKDSGAFSDFINDNEKYMQRILESRNSKGLIDAKLIEYERKGLLDASVNLYKQRNPEATDVEIIVEKNRLIEAEKTRISSEMESNTTYQSGINYFLKLVVLPGQRSTRYSDMMDAIRKQTDGKEVHSEINQIARDAVTSAKIQLDAAQELQNAPAVAAFESFKNEIKDQLSSSLSKKPGEYNAAVKRAIESIDKIKYAGDTKTVPEVYGALQSALNGVRAVGANKELKAIDKLIQESSLKGDLVPGRPLRIVEGKLEADLIVKKLQTLFDPRDGYTQSRITIEQTCEKINLLAQEKGGDFDPTQMLKDLNGVLNELRVLERDPNTKKSFKELPSVLRDIDKQIENSSWHSSLDKEKKKEVKESTKADFIQKKTQMAQEQAVKKPSIDKPENTVKLELKR